MDRIEIGFEEPSRDVARDGREGGRGGTMCQCTSWARIDWLRGVGTNIVWGGMSLEDRAWCAVAALH